MNFKSLMCNITCLDGDTQSALDRAGGLGENSQVRGPPSSPDRPSPPVEQRQLYVKLLRNLGQALLNVMIRALGFVPAVCGM